MRENCKGSLQEKTDAAVETEMDRKVEKIGLGGGCHWCTEAVFQAVKGVQKVEQGFVAAVGGDGSFSEAVIVHFDPGVIPLKILIEIHLHTHSSTSAHSMREKYRSAVYSFYHTQEIMAKEILKELQRNFEKQLITKVYSFKSYRSSPAKFQNYYFQNPEKPFCKTFIDPKLKFLLQNYSDNVKFQYS